MPEPRVRFSAITAASGVVAVGALIAGFVVATRLTEHFRASLDTVTPDHATGGAYLAAGLHCGALVLAVVALLASLRRRTRHPIALTVTMALPLLCLFAALSDLYIARQIIDTGWTGY